MLLHEVVVTTEAVASTSSRLAKIDALADAAPTARSRRDRPRDRIPHREAAAGAHRRRLARRRGARGRARGGADADGARCRRCSGPAGRGVRARARSARAAPSWTTWPRTATAAEWDFLTRVILGEMRTGALEGVLLDAVTRASGHDAAVVRRAAMLSGDLGETARDRAGGRAGRARRGRTRGRAPGAADAGLDGGFGGRGDRDRRGRGIRRVQARRRAHPGASSREPPCGVYTRNLADITHRVPEIVEVVRALPVQT